MKYEKPALTFDQQADLLLRRGLVADRDELIRRLSSVSYYRLAGYIFPFRNPDDSLIPGTNLTDVWSRYTFDRRLRLLVMDAIERIEVSVRTCLVYEFAQRHNAFDYLNPSSLPGLESSEHSELMVHVAEVVLRSQEQFMEHFRAKYGDVHNAPPIWILGELLSFGETARLFKGVSREIRQAVSLNYRVHHRVLRSWFLHLNTVRNVCAHHSRLWDRVFRMKPQMPHGPNDSAWLAPVRVTNSQLFGTLTICKYMMEFVAPTSKWPERFNELLTEYPSIPIQKMGFPTNWKDCPIWL